MVYTGDNDFGHEAGASCEKDHVHYILRFLNGRDTRCSEWFDLLMFTFSAGTVSNPLLQVHKKPDQIPEP